MAKKKITRLKKKIIKKSDVSAKNVEVRVSLLVSLETLKNYQNQAKQQGLDYHTVMQQKLAKDLDQNLETRIANLEQFVKHQQEKKAGVTIQSRIRHPIQIRWSNVDQAWVARVPSLDGVVTHGDSKSEAFANAQEAIALHLESVLAETLQPPVLRRRRRR